MLTQCLIDFGRVFHITGPQYEYDRFVIYSITRATMTISEEDARVGLIAIPLLIVIKSER